MSEGKSPEGIFEGYKKGEDIPLFSYGVLAGVFNLVFALFLLVARVTGRPIPERIEARDIALLGMAAHKVSLVGPRTPLRAPCAPRSPRLQEKESPKKLDEKPRGEGLQRSVGELLTCKFCLSVWVASFFTYGLVLVPRLTRLVAAVSPSSPSRTTSTRSTRP
jgi:hypothetical protein